MKKTLLCAATALALALSAPVAADENHGCMDAACDQQLLFATDSASGGGDSAPAADASRYGTWGIDTAGMDRSVKPGADFFGFVNGNWARNTPIPSDRSSYGSFMVLRDLSEARVRTLVEGYSLGDPAKDGDAAKIAALYRGFMDEAAIEALGAKPLKPHLAAIAKVKDKAAMAELMGRASGSLGGSFFGAFVSDDARNPDQYALYLGQSGLGLGDREMYLDAKFAPQRERYQAYIEQMLTMVGWPKAKDNAAGIVAMETRIAQAHWTRAESRNRDKTYNPATLAEMETKAPGFPWATFFKAAGVDSAERAVLRQDRVGLVDNWLRHIHDVKQKHQAIMDATAPEDRLDRLCELNVIEQVLNLAQSTVIYDAWARGQEVSVHGLIYGLQDGIVRNLNISIHSLNAICPAYNQALSSYSTQA